MSGKTRISRRTTRDHRIFIIRTASIYRHQYDRAKAAGVELPYTLAELREHIRLGALCHYCPTLITARNLSLDHETPICRGGTWQLGNLVVCCSRCNGAKGILTGVEFGQLLSLVMHWPEEVEINLLARLQAGGHIARFRNPSHN
jgi:5-methylcytosine-specific restriction endonuclease McrA